MTAHLRWFGAVALTAVVAAGATVAVFAGLLARAKPELRLADQAPPVTRPTFPALSTPPPIGPLRQPRIAAEADLRRSDREISRATGSLRVRVTIQGVAAPGLGLAVFDGTSGARIAWRPAPPAPGPWEESLVEVPSGLHVVTLSHSGAAARDGYLLRSEVEVQAGTTAELLLQPEICEVLVESAQALEPYQHLHLQRLDAPGWRHVQRAADAADDTASRPATTSQGLRRSLGLLGAGRYRLIVVDTDRVIEFAVPQTRLVRLP